MIREFLFILCFGTAAVLTGFLPAVRISREGSLAEAFCMGTVTLFAAFHLLAYPMLLLNGSFRLLCVSSAAVSGALTAAGAYFFFRGKTARTLKEQCRTLTEDIKSAPVLYAAVLVLVFLLFYMEIFYYHPTRDDGYYLTRSMEILETGILDIHPSVSWYGEYLDGYPDIIDASTLALFISVCSRLSGIAPALLCRRAFAALMAGAHLAAVLTAQRSLFPRKKDSRSLTAVFLILYLLFLLLARKVNSAGYWMVRYIWQGKAVLIGLVFPLLTASCARLIRNRETLKPSDWVPTALVLTAGLFISTVGLFLPVILFFGCGAAFLLGTRFRYWKKVIGPALLCVLPVLLTAVLCYIEVLRFNTRYIGLGKTEIWSWTTQFLQAVDLFQFLLFVLSAVYFLVRGSTEQKILLAGAPAVLFATFLNPLLAQPVSTWVTTPEVYFRLFWMLPVYFLPALAGTDILHRVSGKSLQKTFLLIFSAFALLFGFDSSEYDMIRPDTGRLKTLFSYPSRKRENPWGVSQKTVMIADGVLADWSGTRRPHLLTRFDPYFELRQYSIGIATRWDSINKAGPELPGEFFTDYGSDRDYAALHDLLQKYDTDYVCLENTDEDLSEYGYAFVCTAEDLTVWKVVPQQIPE